jgi:hypothetical protein
MAQDVLTHHYLLDEDAEQDISKEFSRREEK